MICIGKGSFTAPWAGVMPWAVVPGVSLHVTVLPSLWLFTDAEPCEKDTVVAPAQPPAARLSLSRPEALRLGVA